MPNSKLAIVTSVVVFAAAAGAAAATVVRAHASDVSGFVSTDDGNGITVTVSAFRSGAQDSPVGGKLGQATGFLFYEVDRCNLAAGTCTFQRGHGNVPSSAIGGGSQNVNVNVNTASVSGYTNESCDGSGCTNNFCETVTCAPGPGGSVTVSFSARTTGGFSESVSGTTQTSVGSTTMQTNGTSSFTTANASGTVLGTSVPAGGFASIQSIHQATITITKR